MKVVIIYIYPNNSYRGLADRFVNSYQVCKTNIEHELVVITQAFDPDDETRGVFSSIPNVRFIRHDNSGYDIGAFQKAAREIPCDLMVFLGASGYLKRQLWLDRMVEARQKYGDTLYGTMGNRGGGGIQPHIRTTGFFMSPALLNQYPRVIDRPELRYGFEHGPECLTTWILGMNLVPWLVAHEGEYEMKDWDNIPKGMHKEDQANLLTGDRLTCPPYYPTP
jgi:hypothetical protein